MELEAEDGHVIFLEKGCKRELGRGPELATQDRSVSRHQVLLELQELSAEDQSNGSGYGSERLYVQALGPNPICIAHSCKDSMKALNSADISGEVELSFLKKGENGWLSIGDKISLSISQPMFFTVKKGCQKSQEKRVGFVERTCSTTGDACSSKAAEGRVDVPMKDEKSGISNNDLEDDLLASWKARKKAKGMAKSPESDGINQNHQIDDGERSLLKEADNIAAREEDGIAEAVARRQRRAYERRQQEQLQQVLLNESTSKLQEDQLSDRTPADSKSDGVQRRLSSGLKDKLQIDPVKEFGFLLEGSEFGQYEKHVKHDKRDWDWHIGKKHIEEEDEEQDGGNVGRRQVYIAGKGKNKKFQQEEDEEWVGEDEEEKLRIGKVLAPKTPMKVALRSHDPSSAHSKRSPAKSKGIQSKNPKGDRKQKEEGEDETLGGFIVDEEDDEELGELSDEEEWSDDDDEDEDDDDDDDDDEDEEMGEEGRKGRQKNDKKPCKHGKDCYRKNKDHLEKYWHP